MTKHVYSSLNNEIEKKILNTIPIPALIWTYSGSQFFLVDYNIAAENIGPDLEEWKKNPATEIFKFSNGIIGSLRACYDFKRNIESEGWYPFGDNEVNCYFRIKYASLGNDNVIMYIEDITKEIEIEEDVQLYFETAIDMLCIKGFDGKFKKISKTWSLTLGWDEEKILSSHYRDFVHKDDIEATNEAFNALLNGGIVVGFRNRFLCSDGTYKWLEWNSNSNTERGIIISAARDVTVQKKAEKALKESIKAADDANNAKSEFLANMSHEIRTPLNAVIGFSELLKSQVIDEHLHDYVESINTSGKNLLGLINDILDLSKLEAGMFEINIEEVSIIQCFNEIERMFSQKLKDKHILYKFHMSPEINYNFRIDETRFKQVLLNIIGNAIKFTEQGEIIVFVEAKKNTKNIENVDLIITIEDSGIGIRKEELSTIFESFKQTGDARTKFKGSGLGLTISKRLVELMNGDIAVKSELGKGTKFTICYKNVEIRKCIPAVVDKDSNDLDITFDSASILVVDDDDINRFLVREILVNRNVNLHEAKDGHEALNAISIIEPDLILMDIKLPIMNGFEAAKAIRNGEKKGHVPIIALTASINFEEANHKMSGVFDAVLTKPISINELLKILSGFLPYKTINKEKTVMVVPEKYEDETNEFSTLTEKEVEKWIKRLEIQLGAVKLSEVNLLSDELEEMFEIYKIDIFSKWSKLLTTYTKEFDIDEINHLINNMIHYFKKVLKEGGYV